MVDLPDINFKTLAFILKIKTENKLDPKLN